MRLAGLLVCLLCAGAAQAQRIEACDAFDGLQYPAADMPSAAEAADLVKCSPTSLYYGIGTKFDYQKARLCDFVQKEKGAYYYSSAVLMMVYANGQGVSRNYELAKKAACDIDGAAPAEIEARLGHLDRMRLGQAGSQPRIDVCDDITSGVAGGYCAGIRSSMADQEREQVFESLTVNWNADSRKAFTELRKKAQQFAEARSGGEVSKGGTAQAAFMTEEEDRQKRDFLKSLRDFDAGRLPVASQRDFLAADRELNEVYQWLKRTKDSEYYGEVKFADIVATQRVWLAYRDEWVAFGKVRYPAVADYAWKAYFTRKRTEMLKKLLTQRS
jgi:uncharacterized protein YecT (DUF1311 family)